MNLYIKTLLSFEDLAARIHELALPTFESQLRDGLNLGGGEYFKFSRDEKEILFVCNDADHAEVFIELFQNFPYYCYARRGADDLLEDMQFALHKHGFDCTLGDER